MSAFLARRKWLILTIVGLVVCVCIFEVWSRWVTATPLSAPIALSPAGKIDKELEIRRGCPHSLELAFSNKSHLYSEAGTLSRADKPESLGSGKAFDGVRIPVQWSLTDPTSRLVASGEGDAAGSFAWTSTEFFRPVVTGLHLSHGQYRMQAALLRDIPELDGLNGRLVFACHNGKISSGWQGDLLFFGQFVEKLIVLPFVAMLAAILLGLETKHLGPRRIR